jgi:phosphoenolpyruvate---glycerone phosphotransferase subunit DhaM
VRLVDAPFVEGAVAAAVVASSGAPLDDVARAAEEARDARKL